MKVACRIHAELMTEFSAMMRHYFLCYFYMAKVQALYYMTLGAHLCHSHLFIAFIIGPPGLPLRCFDIATY